jgi:hypothetical protein
MPKVKIKQDLLKQNLIIKTKKNNRIAKENAKYVTPIIDRGFSFRDIYK